MNGDPEITNIYRNITNVMTCCVPSQVWILEYTEQQLVLSVRKSKLFSPFILQSRHGSARPTLTEKARVLQLKER